MIIARSLFILLIFSISSLRAQNKEDLSASYWIAKKFAFITKVKTHSQSLEKLQSDSTIYAKRVKGKLHYFKNNIDPSNHSTFTISVDLSDVINSFQNPIDFIKMDAEGVEYQILEKMLNRSACYRVKYIYVEDHSRKMIEPDWFHHRDTVMRQYKQAGFKKISMNEPSNHFCLFKD